jgi:hypothetical protein
LCSSTMMWLSHAVQHQLPILNIPVDWVKPTHCIRAALAVILWDNHPLERAEL